MRTLLILIFWILLISAGCFLLDCFNLWGWLFGCVIYGGLTMCVIGPFLDFTRK